MRSSSFFTVKNSFFMAAETKLPTVARYSANPRILPIGKYSRSSPLAAAAAKEERNAQYIAQKAISSIMTSKGGCRKRSLAVRNSSNTRPKAAPKIHDSQNSLSSSLTEKKVSGTLI
ncbi:MAG TPA: hypothetical protein P5191_08000 [Ruminococcus sp.]|nr:hypothetical protein [Ruminococcus sp.]